MYIAVFSLLSISLFAQKQNNVEMQFAIGIHQDTSFVYTYKPPYLIRNTKIYAAKGLPKQTEQKDTIYIDVKTDRALTKYAKRYMSTHRSNTEMCAAWTPVYAMFSWQEKENGINISYRYNDTHAHCHNNVLPQHFWDMKKFLDSFFVKDMAFNNKKHQQDYVITQQNDTIYGKVRHNIYPLSNTISITASKGKQKFRMREYKAYQQKGKKFMKVRHLSSKGKEWFRHCRVVTEGKLALLRETAFEAPDYFLHYKGEFYMLIRRYFPNELWKELIKCPAFASKYKDFHRETGGKMIIFQRDPNIWQEMVNYYNQNCGQ